MQILILGGSRFIGYLTLCNLINDGHDVSIFNRQRTIPPQPFPRKVKMFAGDRNDESSLRAVFFKRSYDVVIDISGYTELHVRNIFDNFAAQIGQYIFISSVSVYCPPIPYRVTERHSRMNRSNSVGYDKTGAEDFLFSSSCLEGTPITVLRPHGVFGIYDPCQSGQIFYRLSKGLPILGLGNQEARFNPVCVADLVKAITLTIENKNTFGKAYNIAGNCEVTLRNFTNLCGHIVGCRAAVTYVTDISTYHQYKFVRFKRHAGPIVDWTDVDYVCSNSRAQADIGVIFTPLKDALTETYSWLTSDSKAINYFQFRGERKILGRDEILWFEKLRWAVHDGLDQIWMRSKILIKRMPIMKKVLGPSGIARKFRR